MEKTILPLVACVHNVRHLIVDVVFAESEILFAQRYPLRRDDEVDPSFRRSATRAHWGRDDARAATQRATTQRHLPKGKCRRVT